MEIQNQDGVTTEISISNGGEISVDILDLHNGAFALVNRFYALDYLDESFYYNRFYGDSFAVVPAE